eukprot:890719-Rhodomonas_salina.1
MRLPGITVQDSPRDHTRPNMPYHSTRRERPTLPPHNALARTRSNDILLPTHSHAHLVCVSCWVVIALHTKRMLTSIDERADVCCLDRNQAEQRHAALELYLWLAQRFSDAFPDLKLAQDVAERSNRFIQVG